MLICAYIVTINQGNFLKRNGNSRNFDVLIGLRLAPGGLKMIDNYCYYFNFTATTLRPWHLTKISISTCPAHFYSLSRDCLLLKSSHVYGHHNRRYP